MRAVLASLIVLLLVRHFQIANRADMKFSYPQARRDESVVDDYHGTKVADPYRWLEDPNSAETKAFVEAQNAISSPFIEQCEYRQQIQDSLTEKWNFAKYSSPAEHGGHYYYYHNTGLQNQSVMYVQDSLDGEPLVFLDPNKLSEDGTLAISGTAFSEDGSYFAYGLSQSGSDWITIKFKECPSGKDLPDTLEHVKFSSMAWTHDNKGMFYNRYPVDGKSDGTETTSNFYHRLYYHVLGTKQSEDVLAVEFVNEPKWKLETTVANGKSTSTPHFSLPSSNNNANQMYETSYMVSSVAVAAGGSNVSPLYGASAPPAYSNYHIPNYYGLSYSPSKSRKLLNKEGFLLQKETMVKPNQKEKATKQQQKRSSQKNSQSKSTASKNCTFSSSQQFCTNKQYSSNESDSQYGYYYSNKHYNQQPNQMRDSGSYGQHYQFCNGQSNHSYCQQYGGYLNGSSSSVYYSSYGTSLNQYYTASTFAPYGSGSSYAASKLTNLPQHGGNSVQKNKQNSSCSLSLPVSCVSPPVYQSKPLSPLVESAKYSTCSMFPVVESVSCLSQPMSHPTSRLSQPMSHPTSPVVESASYPSRPTSPVVESASYPSRPTSPVVESASYPSRPTSPVVESASYPFRPTSPIVESASYPSYPNSFTSYPFTSYPSHPTSPVIESASYPSHPTSPVVESASYPFRPTSPIVESASYPSYPNSFTSYPFTSYPSHPTSPVIESASYPSHPTSPVVESASYPFRPTSPIVESASYPSYPNSFTSYPFTSYPSHPTSPVIESASYPSHPTSPVVESASYPFRPTSPIVESASYPSYPNSFTSYPFTSYPSHPTSPVIESASYLSHPTSPVVESASYPSRLISPIVESASYPSYLNSFTSYPFTSYPSHPTSPVIESASYPSHPTSPVIESASYPSHPTSPVIESASYPSRPTSPIVESASYPSRPTSPIVGSASYPSRPTSPIVGSASYPSRPTSPIVGSASYPSRPTSPIVESASYPSYPNSFTSYPFSQYWYQQNGCSPYSYCSYSQQPQHAYNQNHPGVWPLKKSCDQKANCKKMSKMCSHSQTGKFAYTPDTMFIPNFRGAEISDCGKYLLLSPNEGCDPVNRLFYVELDKLPNGITGKLPYTILVDNFDAQYEYITNEGTVFTFLTNLNAPKYKVINIDFNKPEQENWQTLIEEDEHAVLEWVLCVNKNKLVLCYLKDVKNKMYIHSLGTGKLLKEIPLDIGTVIGCSGKKKNKEIFIHFMSFLTPGVIYRVNVSVDDPKPEVYRLIKVSNFDFSQFEIKQIFYPSKDGTKIPMFLVHKKGLVLDGKNPTYLYGYGGFEISIKPTFSVSRLVFLKDLGGLCAVANIRGGGEYGETWHRSGTHSKKQNVFDDFQAAAEYLINQKYTTPEKLVIHGHSNGGLLTAACINQQPELFGAAVVQVGVLDMLRFHKFTIGHAWTTDFGCSEVPEHFKFLKKYSPLHNVRIPKDDIQYPSTLLLTADHDDRVVPLHSLKYIAELQHTMKDQEKQTKPLMIKVDTKAGHGSGKPTAKMIQEHTDLYCFIMKTLEITWHES